MVQIFSIADYIIHSFSSIVNGFFSLKSDFSFFSTFRLNADDFSPI